MNLVSDLVFIALGIAAAGWLSGYDPRVTGEDPKADIIRRTIRVGITAVLLLSVLINGYFALYTFVVIGIYWAGCGSEFLAQQFHRAIDPEDKRAFDPKETHRNLDLLAQFVREGRTRAALDLCKQLETSGDASPAALEATLHHLYQNILDSIPKSPGLVESRRLRELGQFTQAEALLMRIIESQPENWAAMLLLMRVYAEDLLQPDKALALLTPASGKEGPRRCLHPAFAKYAGRSIEEWHQQKKQNQISAASDSAPAVPVAVKEVSADELLKDGQLSTAIELLENTTREQPGNFDVWMKLAEAHALYCSDLNRAGKIFRAMELSSNFTPREIELTRAKLREWHAARRR